MNDRDEFQSPQIGSDPVGAGLLLFVVLGLVGGWCGLEQRFSNLQRGKRVAASKPIYDRYREDNRRFQAYFEERFGHFDLAGHEENYAPFRDGPIEDRHLVVLGTVYSGLEHGSFLKWIYLCGYLHEDFVEALKAIGAPRGAAAFDELRTFFPGNAIPANEDERYDFYQRVTNEETEDDAAAWHRLRQVSNRFHDNCENIYSLALEYHKAAKQARSEQ